MAPGVKTSMYGRDVGNEKMMFGDPSLLAHHGLYLRVGLGGW